MSELITTFLPRLEAQLRGVLSRHAKIEAHLQNKDRELPQDWPDLAQVLGNDEVLEALDHHSRAEVDRLRWAIHRMEDGSYGICSRCGGAIGSARLHARPTVATCFSCASQPS